MAERETIQVNFRLEAQIKAWLEKKAERDERSQGWLINRALREEMQRDEQIKHA